MTGTQYFNLTQPDIGNTTNWGLTTNADWSTVDSALYAANGGFTTGINSSSSATTIMLTNPLASTQEVTLTAGSQGLVLPVMNATFSPVVGGVLTVKNTGSYAFQIFAQDGSTSILTALNPGATVYITVLTIATANGTFLVDTGLAGGGTITGNLTVTGTTTLEGTTTVPTATYGDNTTNAATTAFVQAALMALYPVGSLYANYSVATNPATLFGFGTWTTIAGLGLVGVGTGTDSNSVTQTFTAGTQVGEYVHTLTTNELAAHTHIQNAHNHIPSDGSSFLTNFSASATLMTSGAQSYGTQANTNSVTAVNQNAGGSAAHNNVQPVVGVYLWYRSA